MRSDARTGRAWRPAMTLAEWLAALAAAGTAWGWAGAVQAHDAHAASAASARGAAPAARVPRLKLLSPVEGATLGADASLSFETAAPLKQMTLGGLQLGVHLHVILDDETLMPAWSDLQRVGPARYRYRFDPPLKPGPHTLGVLWSDARHRTIEASVRRVRVTVAAPAVPAKP